MPVKDIQDYSCPLTEDVIKSFKTNFSLSDQNPNSSYRCNFQENLHIVVKSSVGPISIPHSVTQTRFAFS